MFSDRPSVRSEPVSCDVSIVLPNWNGGDVLTECVDSILELTRRVNFELILVDNGSTDESRASAIAYAERDPRVTAILNDENLYFAQACNQGFEASCGRYILIANNDVMLREDSITHMVSYADEHPDVAVVTPQFIGPDGQPQEFVRRLPNALYILAHYHVIGRAVDRFLFGRFFQNRYFYRDRSFEQTADVEQAGASFSLFRRSVIDELGCLFDEAFPLLFNDVDLSRRIKDRGFSSRIIPSMPVVHHAGVSSRKMDPARYRRHQDRAMFRYFRIHHPIQHGLLVLAWPLRWLKTRSTHDSVAPW